MMKLFFFISLLATTVCLAQTTSKTHLFFCPECVGPNSLEDTFDTVYTKASVYKGKTSIPVGSGYNINPSTEALLKKNGVAVTNGKYLKPMKEDNESLNKWTVKKKLLTYLKSLDKTKSPLSIEISDHGWNGTMAGGGKLPPANSGMVICTDNPSSCIITHEEFGQLLTEAGLTGATAPKLQILGEHCYGGGVHYLSQKFPNVCTASFISNNESRKISGKEPDAFWDYYNQERASGRSPSFAETFNAAWYSNNLSTNKGGGLGSTQYVRDVLSKKGIVLTEPNHNDLWRDVDLYAQQSSPCGTCTIDIVLPAVIPSTQADALIADVQAIYPSQNTVLSPSGFTGPKDYMMMLKDLKANEASYQAIVLEFQKKMQTAKAEWLKLEEEEKLIKNRQAGITDYLDYTNWGSGFDEKKKADLAANKAKQTNAIAEFTKYKADYLPKIRKYIRMRDMALKLSELSVFRKNFSPTSVEVATYKRMTECESLPF